MMTKKLQLDKYEQDIEDNYEKLKPVKNEGALIKKMQQAAKVHLQNKKPITIRVSMHDVEIIKIKASKKGIPYQTYINMLIHRDASSF